MTLMYYISDFLIDDISGESISTREVDSLLQIKEISPKMLITKTKHEDYQYEGIRIVDVANWLRKKIKLFFKNEKILIMGNGLCSEIEEDRLLFDFYCLLVIDFLEYAGNIIDSVLKYFGMYNRIKK